jgi:hypothetical protein
VIHGGGWSQDDEGRIELAAHRAVRRRYRSLGYRLKRAGIIFCVYILAGSFVSIDPGRWFHPKVCGTEKSATVAAEPAAVKVAKDQGRLLRRLAGKPPTPEATDRFARHAADVVVVTTLAFLASARDEKEPAKVTAYNTAHARRVAAQDAAWKVRCTPPCPPNQPGQIGPGTMTVVAGGPEATARAAAVAAGFTGRHLDEAMAVARLETGGTFKATAANPHSSARGVWQIMLSAHQDDPDIRNWADPFASARMAYRISGGGTHWSPAWTTWPAAQRTLGSTTTPPMNVGAGSIGSAPCAAPKASTYTTGAGKGWGGYRNGGIPLSALAHPAQAPTAWFRPDAAAAFDRLSAAYAGRFGHPLKVTDSYRDYAHQVSTKAAKGYLAARPGTSNHGWGLAADVQVGGYGSADYQWLLHNAPAYGWSNPGWARAGGSKHEPWHYEFNPAGAAA